MYKKKQPRKGEKQRIKKQETQMKNNIKLIFKQEKLQKKKRRKEEQNHEKKKKMI